MYMYIISTVTKINAAMAHSVIPRQKVRSRNQFDQLICYYY